MELKPSMSYEEQLNKLIEHVEAIKVLMEQYEEDIDMSLIGFPDDYLEILENNIC